MVAAFYENLSLSDRLGAILGHFHIVMNDLHYMANGFIELHNEDRPVKDCLCFLLLTFLLSFVIDWVFIWQ